MLVIALSLSVPVYAEDDKNPGDGHTPGTPSVDSGGSTSETSGSLTETIVTENGMTLVNVIVALFGLT